MSYRSRPFLAALLTAFTLLALGWALPAAAETTLDDSDTVMLVAKPALEHPIYGHSILIAKPLGNGVHVGFILNKPTKVTLGQAFPEHGPSQKVVDPLYLGGPVDANMVFALVQRHDSPGTGSVELAPNLYVALAGETVDRIIEDEPDHARFLFGSVVWRSGELQEEIDKGFWYVMKPDSDVALKKNVANLWEELVQKSERQASML
jgi:putative transcriptional regulator